MIIDQICGEFLLLRLQSTITMEKQKMLNSLKNPHRDFKPRFSYAEEQKKIAETVRGNAVAEQMALLQLFIVGEQNNIRQKFKIYKRYIDSSDEKDHHQREFLIKYLVHLHVQQYVFGNTESKPVLMNTLKRLNQLKTFTVQEFVHIFNAISIEEYQQGRNLLELLDMLTRSNNMQFLEKAPYLQSIFSITLREFELGCQKIFVDTFKLKWIEYFVDVLRSLNNLYRLYSRYFEPASKKAIVINLRKLAMSHKILTKEVLTQIHLLLLQINPNEQRPSDANMICVIHYLHARNVILGENVLPQMMKLLTTLKQTEQKCQLAPILLKAFQNYYPNYKDKQNVFDMVVTLFQVGRSIYCYLQEIVSIIMKDPEAHWNLQGNFIKKFFIATVALKHGFPTDVIFSQWPTIIRDTIVQAGNMTIPYANDCAQKILEKLYEEEGKDYNKWVARWIEDYKACLLSAANKGYIRGIVEFINPIILSVNSEPAILKEILAISEAHNHTGTILIGVVSLLKCFKELNKIIVDSSTQSFVHIQDKSLVFHKYQIKDMLLHNDSNVALKALEFLTANQKASMPMEPLQLELTLQFFTFSLKTSLPQYRKCYLNVAKKMFDRLRTVYDNQLTKTEAELKKNKRYKPKEYFEQFKTFLQSIIAICYDNIFPDVIFQLANPALQILALIATYFSRDQTEVKKGQVLEPSHILKQTTFFQHRNFQNLLCCLQSSYQSVRILSHQILTYFYDLQAFDQLRSLWSESLMNANKLTIKSYEYACRILAFISQTYPHILQLPNRYALKQLNICEMFLRIMKERYSIFKNQFATQEESYYHNLIHGILTVFSYTLDHLASSIRADADKFKPYFEDIKTFLAEFFEQINQIILFSVEICSSNISTVVLDSLPQSQTDKKYKVDCRGHFLEETSKNVGNFFQTTALLTSMQNQEQGVENMLVVSFYLLTREAGLVFQSIGNMVGTNYSNIYIPSDSLVQLVNTYFYALINLKHMGSVDRISNGLGKMAKVIFDNEDKKLSQLPEKLLEKLLTNLKEGNFTNILRRSAGVPYAFTCLLKSEALKRKQMIENTISTLLELSQETAAVQLRIHALNILKKLFQDGDLKGQLDPYVSSAFISSIRGFTGEEWGVRNSSLMLFSVLANRTVGIKPTYNLLQFFHRCPELVDFFTQQLKDMELNTMYPPLYPIVLLLSRLLPFDLKEMPKMSNKSELNLKQIRKDKLLQMLPLIESAGRNSNYMGRVMTAKAILPFMQINGIIPYCLALLQNISSITANNEIHYKLSATFHLLSSLIDITQDQKFEIKIDLAVCKHFSAALNTMADLILRRQSPVVTELLLKIIHHIMLHYKQQLEPLQDYQAISERIFKITKIILKNYLSTPNLIITMNMGDSVAIKQCLKLHNLLLDNFESAVKVQRIVENFSEFLLFLKGQIQSNEKYLLLVDTEIIEEYLVGISNYLKRAQHNHLLNQTIQNVVKLMDLSNIASDNILIEVLTIRAILKIQPENNLIAHLQKQEEKTNNHFLKIAIFKYIESISRADPLLLTLLHKYSRPQELQELRECCVEYLQFYPTVEEAHFIPYIRLLQDQQYEIRLETAKILAKKLSLPQYNEQVLKNYLLERLQVRGFEQLLLNASDFAVKIRNNQQDRIFSYDKPNKYRSDISNIIYCLLNNAIIRASMPSLPTLMQKLFAEAGVSIEAAIDSVDKYINDIINRNEYQFENIVRLFLMNKPKLKGKFTAIFSQHPLLFKIYQLYI